MAGGWPTALDPHSTGTVARVKISTTPEIPGHRITGYVEAVSSVKSERGKQAEDKVNGAYTAAIEELEQLGQTRRWQRDRRLADATSRG